MAVLAKIGKATLMTLACAVGVPCATATAAGARVQKQMQMAAVAAAVVHLLAAFVPFACGRSAHVRSARAHFACACGHILVQSLLHNPLHDPLYGLFDRA
jgi:hypothetical protein